MSKEIGKSFNPEQNEYYDNGLVTEITTHFLFNIIEVLKCELAQENYYVMKKPTSVGRTGSHRLVIATSHDCDTDLIISHSNEDENTPIDHYKNYMTVIALYRQEKKVVRIDIAGISRNTKSNLIIKTLVEYPSDFEQFYNCKMSDGSMVDYQSDTGQAFMVEELEKVSKVLSGNISIDTGLINHFSKALSIRHNSWLYPSSGVSKKVH